MSDVASAERGGANFSELVDKAFIEPIRSVTIIDDQYPTWQTVFSGEGYDPTAKDPVTGKFLWARKEKILEVVERFRQMEPPRTVDIHDGQNIDDIGTYLHQSDLLVLDYQLENLEPYGVISSKVIKYLMDNNHFNLVVVHTSITNLNEPFNVILKSLLSPTDITQEKADKGFALIGDLEDDGRDNAESDVTSALDDTAYIAFRTHLSNGRKASTFLRDAVEMNAFRVLAEDVGWNMQEQLAVLDWGIYQHDKTVGGSVEKERDLRWRPPVGESPSWIRSNGAFVAFAEKQTTDLVKVIRDAIADWQPSPSRLLSARIRAEISQRGVGAEDNALRDKHAYWHFYRELKKGPLDPSELSLLSHRKTMLEGHAAQHMERLFDQISESAVAFGLEILKADLDRCDQCQPSFAHNYGISSNETERKKALDHFNAHISTKPVSGWHLQPGHIFKLEKEMWVCLSPSCDLVPQQKASVAVRGSKSAAVKPFVAVKLTPIKSYSDVEVNSNTLVFWRDGDAINKFSIYPKTGGFGSPVWRLFVASDFGKFQFDSDRKAQLKLGFLCGEAGEMAIKNINAPIVAQLRYEYALNLIQKLGVEFTRIGLDFSVPPKSE